MEHVEWVVREMSKAIGKRVDIVVKRWAHGSYVEITDVESGEYIVSANTIAIVTIAIRKPGSHAHIAYINDGRVVGTIRAVEPCGDWRVIVTVEID